MTTSLTDAAFAAAWNDSDSVSDFCRRLGIQRIATAYSRASALRKKGIFVKSYAVEKVRRNCEHCGKEFRVSPSKVKEGNGRYCSRQCSWRPERNQTHGECYTRLYGIWHGIEQRCNNKNNRAYKSYGGRGITMCKEWSTSYETFRDWANANGYTDELEIDRRNTFGNYEPGNCRWATRREQMRNKRKRTRASTSQYKGVSLSRESGKWTVHVHTPGRPVYRGQFPTEIEAAKEYDRIVRIEFGEYACLNFPDDVVAITAQSADGELTAVEEAA